MPINALFLEFLDAHLSAHVDIVRLLQPEFAASVPCRFPRSRTIAFAISFLTSTFFKILSLYCSRSWAPVQRAVSGLAFSDSARTYYAPVAFFLCRGLLTYLDSFQQSDCVRAHFLFSSRVSITSSWWVAHLVGHLAVECFLEAARGVLSRSGTLSYRLGRLSYRLGLVCSVASVIGSSETLTFPEGAAGQGA